MKMDRRSRKARPLASTIGDVPGMPTGFVAVHNKEGDGGDGHPLRAVYPVLRKRSKSFTIAAYQIYVKRYNQFVSLYNRDVKKQNQMADSHFESHKGEEREKLAFRIMGFCGQNAHLNGWEFNEKARLYNEMVGGEAIKLRKMQTIKQSTEKVFQTMLWEYSNQLQKQSRNKKALGHTYERSVYKMDVNSLHLERAKTEFGLQMLDFCQDTILNHKKRLTEAGILLKGQFRGHERGTLHHINPQILAIEDDFDGKIRVAENQLLTSERPEVFRDTDILTCSITQSNLMESVDKSPLSKIRKKIAMERAKSGMPMLDFLSDRLPSEDFTRSPSGKEQKKSIDREKISPAGRKKRAAGTTSQIKEVPAGISHGNDVAGNDTKNRDTRAKNQVTGTDVPEASTDRGSHGPGTKDAGCSPSQLNTLGLREMVEPAWDFCVNLGNRSYGRTLPIPMERLVMEMDSGTMDHLEFNELLLQDLFKHFAMAYSGDPSYYPWHKVWKNLYDTWLQSYFFMHRNGHHLSKRTVLERYQKLLYTMNSKRYGVLERIRKKKFDPPQALVYLNPYSATKGTLLHHYKFLEGRSPKLDSEIRKVRAELRKNGKLSNAYTKGLEKLRRYFRAYQKHGDTQKLFDQVKYNLPKQIQDDFHKHWESFVLNRSIVNN